MKLLWATVRLMYISAKYAEKIGDDFIKTVKGIGYKFDI
jgi:hypothetical protein